MKKLCQTVLYYVLMRCPVDCQYLALGYYIQAENEQSSRDQYTVQTQLICVCSVLALSKWIQTVWMNFAGMTNIFHRSEVSAAKSTLFM